MFLKPEGTKLEEDLNLVNEKTMEIMKAFFSGKIKLQEIYTSEDYNSFYYNYRNKDITIYSMSIHYRDYDNSDLPNDCFYITLGGRIDKDTYLNLTYYFDSEDRELVKRIMGKTARDSVNLFNKWAEHAVLETKEEIENSIRTHNDPNTTDNSSTKERRTKIRKTLEENKKDFRYDDFILTK